MNLERPDNRRTVVGLMRGIIVQSLRTRVSCRAHSELQSTISKGVMFAIRALALALLPAIVCEGQMDASAGAEVQMHLQQAQNYLKANAPDQAAKEFHEILVIDPNNAMALANLGALEYLRGDCKAAVLDFRLALKSGPNLAKAKAMLAICERRQGDPSSLSHLQDSFARLSDVRLRTQVGIELATGYYEQGYLEHASSTLGELIKLNPDDVDVLYMAQRVYQEMADDSLNKMAILAPHSARMQQVIGERLINSGNAAGAIEHFQQALKIDPRLPRVHYEIGESLMQMSIVESALANAETEFSEALQTDGDNAGIEDQLGLIASLLSQFDKAWDHYKRAVTLDPHDMDAQVGIAKALMELQRPSEAIPYLRSAIEVDPMNTEARYHLALACRKLGMVEESKKQMQDFQAARALKSQVEGIYQQMNRGKKSTSVSDAEAKEGSGAERK
jgi:tetratricopeptide (TPR) repeat protein